MQNLAACAPGRRRAASRPHQTNRVLCKLIAILRGPATGPVVVGALGRILAETFGVARSFVRSFADPGSDLPTIDYAQSSANYIKNSIHGYALDGSSFTCRTDYRIFITKGNILNSIQIIHRNSIILQDSAQPL